MFLFDIATFLQSRILCAVFIHYFGEKTNVFSWKMHFSTIFLAYLDPKVKFGLINEALMLIKLYHLWAIGRRWVKPRLPCFRNFSTAPNRRRGTSPRPTSRRRPVQLPRRSSMAIYKSEKPREMYAFFHLVQCRQLEELLRRDAEAKVHGADWKGKIGSRAQARLYRKLT